MVSAARRLLRSAFLAMNVATVIPLGNLRLCQRTRRVRQFRKWTESLYQTAPRSPHPDDSPPGRGNSWPQLLLFGRFVEQTPRWVVLKASAGIFLSPRERAGVRGTVTL